MRDDRDRRSTRRAGGGGGRQGQGNSRGDGRRRGEEQRGASTCRPSPKAGELSTILSRGPHGSDVDTRVSSQDCLESDRSIGIAALQRTLYRRLGAGDVTAGRQDHCQAARRAGNPGLVCEPIRSLRVG
jgi:hypothetical protein